MLELIAFVMGLVHSTEMGLRWSALGREEIQAEGVAAIVEAASRFDRNRGAPFSACAATYIRARLHALAQSSGHAVVAAQSRPEKRLAWSLGCLVNALEEVGLTRSAAVDLSARHLGVSLEHALPALAMRTTDRISGLTVDSDEETDSVPAAPELAVEEVLDRARVMSVLEKCFAGLTQDERRVVLARTIQTPKPSLDSLGAELGISRDRVKGMLEDAMTHIRFEMRRRGLELYDLLPG